MNYYCQLDSYPLSTIDAVELPHLDLAPVPSI
jgi:hypothetical protein